MKKLLVLGLLASACGTQMSGGRSSSAGAPQPGAGLDPAQSGVVYPAAVPVASVPVPTAYSRYVAETPNAVECIDRFIAMGQQDAALIESAVTRNTITKNSDIIAVGDYQATAVPVLNVINLDSFQSAVDLRLFNPNGFYCIVSTRSFNTKITVQRNCSARFLTMFSQDVKVSGGLHFWWFKRPVSETTTSSGVSSQPEELPCVP
jgi:hypothetical protein